MSSHPPPTTHGERERNGNRCWGLALSTEGQATVMLDWFGHSAGRKQTKSRASSHTGVWSSLGDPGLPLVLGELTCGEGAMAWEQPAVPGAAREAELKLPFPAQQECPGQTGRGSRAGSSPSP